MLTRSITGLLVLCIVALSLGVTAYQLYPLYQQYMNPQPMVQPGTKGKTASTPLRPQRKISEYALFGQFNAQPTPTQQTENLPKTKLRLTLTGVSSSPEAEHASALIEGPDRNTENYAVGDTVPGNATLHEVHPDRVVLSRGGKLETLAFPDEATRTRLLSTVVQEQEESSSPNFQQTQFDQGNNSTPITPQELPRITSEQKQSIRDRLNSLRARLRKQQ